MNNKLTITLTTLRHGGAHRVACMQANFFVNQGYDVTLLLLVSPKNTPYYIDNKVKIVSLINDNDNDNLEQSSFLKKLIRHILYLPKLLCFFKNNKCDIIISHIQGMNLKAIISAKYHKIPIICCEHTSHKMPYGVKGKLAYLERRFAYRYSDLVTVLTSYDFKFYRKYLNNLMLLNNPNPFQVISEVQLKSTFLKRNNTLLAVGDLNRWDVKGFDTLIRTIVKVKQVIPDIKLHIAGYSENNIGLDYLNELSESLGVKEHVTFLGGISNMEELYQSYTAYILSSRNEGFPMTILESLSQGCPVIAFDCISGPEDIIENEVDGLLVKDQNIDDLSEKIINLMNDSELRLNISLNALNKSRLYKEDVIMNDLLARVESILK